MKKYFRLTCIILCLALLFLLSACGTASAPSSTNDSTATSKTETETQGTTKEEAKEYTIKYVTLHVGEHIAAKAFGEVFDEFNKVYKGKIQVEIDGAHEYVDMVNKIKLNIAANEPTDCFWYSEDQNVPGFWGAGKLTDLSPYIDEEFRGYKTEDTWADCMTADGKLVGVPFKDFSELLFYNKDMFEKAGIKAPFNNWDEFIDGCKKLKEKGYAPLGLSTAATGWQSMLIYSALMGSTQGAKYVTGLESFDSPAWIDAAAKLQSLVEYCSEDSIGSDYAIQRQNMMNEKVAMLPEGPWYVGMFMKDGTEGAKKNITSMPFPGVNGPIVLQGPVAKMGSTADPGDTGRMKAIVEFMKFLNKPEYIKKYMVASSEGFVGKVTFTDADGFQPEFAKFYNILGEAKASAPQMRDKLPAPFGNAFEQEVARLFLKEITPEQFVKNLTAKTFVK